MNQTLLLMGPLLPSVMHTLEQSYTVHKYWESDNPAALLGQISNDCVGVVTDGGRGVEAAILSSPISTHVLENGQATGLCPSPIA